MNTFGFLGSSRVVLWIFGGLSAFFILNVEIHQFKILPKEYLLYCSLIIFSLLGLPYVDHYDAFFRYFQVLIANSILIILVYLSIKTVKDFKKVITIIFVSILLLVSYSYFVEDISSLSKEEFYRFDGLLGNANGTAAYSRIGIMLGLCISSWTKKRYKIIALVLCIFFLSYVILLTASRTNFFLLFIIYIFYAYIRFFKMINFGLYFLIITLIASTSYIAIISNFKGFFVYERIVRNEEKTISEIQKEESRLLLYSQAFETMIENPILGVGLNQFIYRTKGVISHTDFLDIGCQLGIFAMLTYMSIFYRLIKRYVKKISSRRWGILPEIMLLLLSTEIIFGLSNPNWFLQLSMIVLSLIITYEYKSLQNKSIAIKKP